MILSRRRTRRERHFHDPELHRLIVEQNARALEEVLRSNLMSEKIAEIGREHVELCALDRAGIIGLVVEVGDLLVRPMVVFNLD